MTIFFLAGIFLGDCLINQTLAQTVGAALEANGAGKKEFDLWEAGCLQRLQTLCLDRKTPADGLSATRGRQNKARIDQI